MYLFADRDPVNLSGCLFLPLSKPGDEIAFVLPADGIGVEVKKFSEEVTNIDSSAVEPYELPKEDLKEFLKLSNPSIIRLMYC